MPYILYITYIGQYILSPASAFWLFLMSFYFEFQNMYNNNAYLIILHNPIQFLLASSLGMYNV